MGFKSKNIITDNSNLRPVPQHYNPDTDEFEVVHGSGGATHFRIIPTTYTVVLQSSSFITSNGTPYTSSIGNSILTFAVRGSSASRTILFEMADPSGVFVPCTAFGVTDPSIMATQTTNGSDSIPESWQVSVPAGWSFRARISAVTSGNVTIQGIAVID